MNVKIIWSRASVELTYEPDFLIDYDESYKLESLIFEK